MAGKPKKKQPDGAAGIHAHETMKLGLVPPCNAPAINLGDVLTGRKVEHPVAADHFAKVEFGMYANDRFGVCGPTGVANLVRLVSTGLLGKTVAPSQQDVFDLYRRSGNPGFDPATGADDNGVGLQTMLEALLEHGIGDGQAGVVKPLAFARVDTSDTTQLDAVVSIFGGGLWGVDLEQAQQSQAQAQPPRWDYAQSAPWGGHCVMHGKYDESTGTADVISWNEDVQTTESFRKNQLGEAWAIVWPWNLAHPAFQQGVDLKGLEQAFGDLTGKTMAVGTQADKALWETVRSFVESPGYGRHEVHSALSGWAHAKGFIERT